MMEKKAGNDSGSIHVHCRDIKIELKCLIYECEWKVLFFMIDGTQYRF